jgi:predicted nucleic-acid-binding Zn-ribbon protein
MKNTILSLTIAFALSALGLLDARASDLEALAGKWVAKVEAQGQAFKQVLDIKKNKFTFEIIHDGGQTALYAEGEVKTEDYGPFKAAKFYNIQGGSSSSDLQSVDDDRTVIYSMGYNEMTVAANFDKERSEPPTVTKYVKTAATVQVKTLVIDKIEMHKSPQSAEYFLCFDVTVGEATKRFNVPDKAYEKDGVTIVTDLTIPNVSKDATCKFVLKLDDVAGDECGEDMDNRSDGSFTVTDSGSKEFKPEGQWRYTIYWHLK